jgi:hypothetical protein
MSSVKPIRLGGQSVLSMEALPQISFTAAECAGEIQPSDLVQLLISAGFTFEEARFLRATRFDGNTRERAGLQLGWTRRRVERVRRRCDRKLSSSAGLITEASEQPRRSRPLGVSYIEQLPSGYRLWVMDSPNAVEVEIIRAERNYISR